MKEIIGCVIEITYTIILLIITYLFMTNMQNNAKIACNISSYDAYVNTKPWCDIINWDEVNRPEREW